MGGKQRREKKKSQETGPQKNGKKDVKTVIAEETGCESDSLPGISSWPKEKLEQLLKKAIQYSEGFGML